LLNFPTIQNVTRIEAGSPLLLILNAVSGDPGAGDQGQVAVYGHGVDLVLQVFLLVALPALVFISLVHFLELIVQRRLARRFGWKSVLWTGWLGTPIHELSHAIMCVVFRHRIDEMALFEPDFETGRLGYVRHSYEKGRWFPELGNVFIAIAPLIGGTLCLLLCLRIFYPGAITESIDVANRHTDLLAQALAIASTLMTTVFADGFLNWKAWLFLYFVLSIGSHMAPSLSDYQGATRAVIVSSLLLSGVLFAIGFLVDDPGRIALLLGPVTAPLMMVLILVAVICLIVATVILILTALWDLIPFTAN